jgi:hypothetical protein
MENLYIPIREDEYDKPFVHFKADSGECEIAGESFPEKTAEFYDKLVSWLKQYMEEIKGPIDLSIRLSYFNTSSSKRILEILILLQKYSETGGEVGCRWHYDPEDLDMEEDIEDLKVISKLSLEMVPEGGETRFKTYPDGED